MHIFNCSLYREKVRVHVDEVNDTAEYYEKKLYYFNEEDSGCRSLEDQLTLVNPVLIVRIF